MKKTFLLLALALALAVVRPAEAQIVYTQVNVSIPVGGSYNLDLNGDGITDFTLKSKLLQGYCQWGDEYVWTLSVMPAADNYVVTSMGQAGSGYTSAMQYEVWINPSQNFNPNSSVMAELYWGVCGIGTAGEWLNLPSRYLGLQFQAADGTTHYGWVKLSTAAYVDQHGHLQTSTLLTGFAYQANPGQGILTGVTQ